MEENSISDESSAKLENFLMTCLPYVLDIDGERLFSS